MNHSRIDKKNLEDVLGLTAMQEGMLYHYLTDPNSKQYFEQIRLRLTGKPDIGLFKEAWQTVVRANEMLRSVIRWEKLDESVQIVLKEKEIPLRVHDLSGTPKDEQPGLLETIRREDKNQAIDLANEPLRLALCILDDREAEMLITFHHIIYDGWSNGVILKEFVGAYETLCRGQKPRSPRKTKYKEFFKWRRSLSENMQDEFWKSYLEGFDTRTSLPYDSGKLAAVDRVKTHKITLLPDLKERVDNCLQIHNITLAALMFTAWGLLLQRYNNSHDVIFGVTVSGRTPAVKGIENIVGLFINTLPLRLKLEAPGEDTVGKMFHRVRHHLNELSAHGHEQTPITRIRKFAAVGKENDLFDSIVVIDNYPLEGIEPGVNLAIRSFDQFEMTNFDLTLQILPSGARNTLDVCFHYNEELFEFETIQRLAGHFYNILAEATETPGCDKKVADIRMISQQEKEQILWAFNKPEIQYRGDKTIHGIIRDQAQKTPDRVAITKTQHLTYREFDRESDYLAGLLQESGVIAGSRVAIMLPRSIQMIVGVLAILKAGAACIPLDITYPAERSNFIIEDSGAMIMIGRAEERKSGRAEFKFSSFFPASPLPRFLASDSSNLAYIIYTSGSTGKPKGALLNHWGIVNHTYTKIGVLGITENDIVGNNFSINVIASVWQILSPLFTGAKLVLYSDEIEWDPYLQFQRAAADGVTVIEVIPPVLKTYLFLLDEGKPAVNLDGLHKIALTSEETKPFLVNRFYEKYRKTKLVDCYGQTECSDDVLHYTIPAAADTRKVPIGTPSLNTQALILSRDNQLQPIGVVGEICVSGAGVAEGYWNRPEMNKEKFVTNPLDPAVRMYRTGDLGCWMPDGNVEYLGRIDHQVKIRGNRVELREIENHIIGFEAVKEAAVIAREDKEGEKSLYAFFEADREATTPEIRQYLLKSLPDYMVPAYFVKMDTLPHTPNGKIDRKALAVVEVKGSIGAGTEYKPPRNEYERKIETIWRELLDKEKIGINDNFFDLGGHSLLLIKLKSKLEKTFDREITIVDLFNYPTIDRQAQYFEGNGQDKQDKRRAVREQEAPSGRSHDVAVIGMALRLPGAANIHEFWKNICDGVESITFFSDEELEGSRVYTYIQANARRIPAGGVLGDIDLFDADFFAFTPREAEIIDPQQRMFLEYAWMALEDAGYVGETYPGSIGVYAGTGWNTYLMNNVLLNPGVIRHLGEFQTMIGNDKDFLPTRVSYKLNLKGPSVTVQSACSTSLVAVHLAKQALVNRECDMALTGGVAVKVPERTGYFYNEGGHLSPDGHCRAFDAEARGTVFGNGLGVVVLKRLADALQDNDHIYAVIKGSAINNDGSLKVGYASPSESGQADVVFAALREADIDPGTIGYVETHGTGTLLGDPVEMTALARAYREYYSFRNNGSGKLGKQYCAVGSVKANIGHLDAAAGVTGFIKAVLCLYFKKMPPSINVTEPNPIIDFPNTPFYVNRSLRDWPDGKTPRRAAASSLGIGGTNAHVILEEYKQGALFEKTAPCTPEKTFDYLLLLSAKTETALEQQTLNLANYLEENPGLNLADAAYTLQVGRARFPYRRMAVCTNADEAVETLSDPNIVKTTFSEKTNRPIIFMFPGQGSQYVDMARGLYQNIPTFRRQIDHCFEILKPLTNYDFKEILYPSPGENSSNQSCRTNIIDQTDITQPVIFMIEYALARLLMAWGVEPYAMIGHSIGEYTAACLSGVLTLEDALKLVAARGALMQKIRAGAMLSVPLPENELIRLVKEKHYPEEDLSIAAVNSSSLCVVSGTLEIIDRFEEMLRTEGRDCSRLHTSHAFHSPMMEPILNEFQKTVAAVPLNKPGIPYLSNVTGNWIHEREAVSPRYWAGHLRNTVRFADGIKILLEMESPIFIEVGPGRTLSTFVLQYANANAGARRNDEPSVIDLVRHPKKTMPDSHYLMDSIGRLWLYGVEFDWASFYAREKPHRIPLPTYPFERKSYWIQPMEDKGQTLEIAAGKQEIDDWFYVPSWKQSVPPVETTNEAKGWLFFLDEPESQPGIGWALADRLRTNREPPDITIVKAGEYFEKHGDGYYTVNPGRCEDYAALLEELQAQEKTVDTVVHLWMPTGVGERELPDCLDRGVYSLLYLTKAMKNCSMFDKINLWVVTRGMHAIESGETGSPGKAVILGPCKVIPQEYPNIACRSVDIDRPIDGDEMDGEIVETLAAEFSNSASCPDTVIAYRGGTRWLQTYDPFQPLRRVQAANLDIPFRLRKNGLYLVIGGLGKIGFTMARYLARAAQARLVLTTLPGYNPQLIRQLEEYGAEVTVVEVDIGDETAMRQTIHQVEQQFGALNGVIHAAGVMNENAFKLIADLDRENCEPHFNAKIHGLVVLEKVLNDKSLDFCMLTSSLSSVLGGLTLYAYSAAHSFMDAFTLKQAREFRRNWFVVNWDEWRIEDAPPGNTREVPAGRKATCLNTAAITGEEGQEVLKRLLSMDNKKITQVVVSTRDLGRRLRQWIMDTDDGAAKKEQKKAEGSSLYQRPRLQSVFEEPKNEAEQIVAEIWQELLGIDIVGVHDDFFQLGGHSLLATKLIARMREVFRIDLPLSILFDKPTIRQLLTHIIDTWGDVETVAEIARTYKEVFSST
ncbi:MAG: amino acid adenylation domain-containing protein [Candidatus Aminicenantes bacterium]|nr:amino acid adenylation domain-containing protein [Candidatus Aminicenantes bacterium]